MIKASVEKLKNDYLRGEYELDEFIEKLTKQSKQDEVNDNPHLGYKTALVPDELLKPQPQEKVDVKSLAYEYAAEICYSGKANPEMTSEEVTKVFERAIANTIQDNELRMAAEKVVEEITLTKGGLERILAQAMGYAWNEAGRYKESLKYPMEAWDNKEKERLKIVDYYFNILNQNKDE